MSDAPRIAVLPHGSLRGEIFPATAWDRLAALGELVVNEHEEASATLDDAVRIVRDARVVITSWGSPAISAELLAGAPELGLHCHAAGTVKPYVTDEEWDKGVTVMSGAAAIAVSVAETTLGWMLIGVKRAIPAGEATSRGGWKAEMPLPPGDLRHKTIGIIGASHVGRSVIRLLEAFENTVLLYDPYVDEDEALALGVRKAELDELMRTSDVVSLHAPSTDETYHMLDAPMFALMKDGAFFINTARGSLVDEEALAGELSTGRIWAFLDVTDPEPPAADHPFRVLSNCILTPHIAGGVETGRGRIGDYVVDEIARYLQGDPLQYAVRRDVLSRIG